jgi:glutathione synthase
MSRKIGIVMDPLGAIKTYKDSTYAMMREIRARGWELFVMEQADLVVKDETVKAHVQQLDIHHGEDAWYSVLDEREIALRELDAILMRKDPPFDMEYIYSTYMLEIAENEGVLIVNKPQSLRDANEKMFTTLFPQCTPPLLVTRKASEVHAFLQEHGDVVLKPLDGMGGASIFRLKEGDGNRNVILETLTERGTRYVMAQRYIPEIKQGDKRILIIDGEVVPYSLARIPPKDDFRGNMAVGGTAVGQEMSERDRWIAEQVGPTLRDKGLIFVGIDVIGDYLTEVNVTSPTGIQELDNSFDLNISGLLMDAVEARLQAKGVAS